MDVEILARVQFAFTIGFHYIYPPLSIGLGLMLVILEGLYLRTGNRIYEMAVRFWIRIFALIFGIGVATGIIMEFEFGTNWATYSKYVGDIFGSALAAEGIFAFALESGFLGILIFGWNRVGPRVHFFSTIMVFFGSLFFRGMDRSCQLLATDAGGFSYRRRRPQRPGRDNRFLGNGL
ncbi:cytochrome ubiquinol oxidase subunit I [Puia sp. P3]|uniref:cytochrome ubiquinol oxidase subunit I n=1 Tax=Puia sp. P3 TaxID=3423952 RepID=UPI003D6655F5